MNNIFTQLKNNFFPLKVVVDTNIFVGAYWNKKSASAGILKAFEERKIKLLYSEDIKKEVLFILRKMKVKKEFLNRVDKIFNSGSKVVVKIQRPEISKRIIEDLDMLEELGGLLDKHEWLGKNLYWQDRVKSMRTSLLNELDFRKEAHNLKTFGRKFYSFDRY